MDIKQFINLPYVSGRFFHSNFDFEISFLEFKFRIWEKYVLTKKLEERKICETAVKRFAHKLNFFLNLRLYWHNNMNTHEYHFQLSSQLHSQVKFKPEMLRF